MTAAGGPRQGGRTCRSPFGALGVPPAGPYWDDRQLATRQTTYLTALLLVMALAAIAGDTYRLGARPVLDRADPGSLGTVNWLHLTAFLFTAAIIIDTAVTISRLSGVHIRRR